VRLHDRGGRHAPGHEFPAPLIPEPPTQNGQQMTDPARFLSTRLIAVAALLFFAPVVASILAPAVVSFGVADPAWARNYPGILFHLALFLLVAKIEAPEWARAAGYGWLVLDVMTGVLTLNGVPHEIYDFVRLGGHIFGGIWIATASLSGSTPVKVIGLVTGIYLSGFTFVSPFLSLKVLGPNAILVLVWLAIIAWQNGSKAPPRLAPAPSGNRVPSSG